MENDPEILGQEAMVHHAPPIALQLGLGHLRGGYPRADVRHAATQFLRRDCRLSRGTQPAYAHFKSCERQNSEGSKIGTRV